MTIRMSGLTSGLDTDSIVSALVSAYSYKKTKYEKAQTKLSWTQDAWKSLNTKVYSLYTNISNLRYSSAYSLKKATASDTTKASVSASADAVNGTQTLSIKKVAQSGYLTGGKLASGTSTSTTLAELGYTGDGGSINIENGDGTSKTISLTSSSTISDVVSALKDSGLNASLDTGNSRIFVSSKKTGTQGDFNLIGADSEGMQILSKLGLSTSSLTNADGTDTATGAAYRSYGQYAMAEDGTVITDSDTVSNNVKAAIANYKAASQTVSNNTTQIDNLTAATSYAKAYTAIQQFNETLTSKGVSDSDKKLINDLAGIKRANALMDEDGNFYAKTTGTDTEGNDVYCKTEAGVATYVSKEVRYTDKAGNVYKKGSDGTYTNVDENAAEDVKTYTGSADDLTTTTAFKQVSETIQYSTEEDEDGNTTQYEVQSRNVTDADGNETTQYYFTKDGHEYVSDTESGDYKATYTGEDGKETSDTISLTKEYKYTQSGEATGISDAQDKYESLLSANGLSTSDSSVTAFEKNVATYNSFEDSAATEDADGLTYSKENIAAAVKAAYTANGETGVNDLLTTYATTISTLKEESTSAQAVMDANTGVATAAELDTASETYEADYAAAVSSLTNQAMSAAQILKDNTYAGSAIKMDGTDAVIELNGAEYTNSNNNFTINGLTIQATATTIGSDGVDNPITVNTATDAQGIYDKIKDFLSEYNSIMNEMCELYNADSASDYEPLTDDEKEAMTDSEIEKWETKIKDSLLRNDTTLNGVISSMTNAMTKGYTVNGTKYALSSFGIETLGYLNSAENEYNAYHIDGDEDDANTSGETDKLMAAINNNPDDVVEFFKQLSTQLYDNLGAKMKASSLSSSYTIYNDKQMASQYCDYTDLIDEWEERISDKEDYYYDRFSTMESSLSKLNSTQSSLSSYLG